MAEQLFRCCGCGTVYFANKETSLAESAGSNCCNRGLTDLEIVQLSECGVITFRELQPKPDNPLTGPLPGSMNNYPFSVEFSIGGGLYPGQAWRDDWRGEAVRNLRAFADAIEKGEVEIGGEMYVRDVNGNGCGVASVRR